MCILSLCAVIAFAQTPHGNIFTDRGDCPCCPKEVKKTNSLLEETAVSEIESIELGSIDVESVESQTIDL